MEFAKWEKSFEDWKKAYETHPDRISYQIFEQKFLEVKNQLLMKRSQIYKQKCFRQQLEADLIEATKMAESILQKFDEPRTSLGNDDTNLSRLSGDRSYSDNQLSVHESRSSSYSNEKVPRPRPKRNRGRGGRPNIVHSDLPFSAPSDKFTNKIARKPRRPLLRGWWVLIDGHRRLYAALLWSMMKMAMSRNLDWFKFNSIFFWTGKLTNNPERIFKS